MQGYKQKKAYIIAEGPMESTARNMLKMIHDRKCVAVVMLSHLIENGKVLPACSVLGPIIRYCIYNPTQESSWQYWPSVGETAVFGEYTVDLITEEVLQGFTIRVLSVINTKVKKMQLC